MSERRDSINRRRRVPCSLCLYKWLFLHCIFKQAPQSADPVLPADLLAFLIRSSRVTDAYLVDPQVALRELDRDLRLKAEPVFLEWNRLNQFAAENLVARFHVREIQVGHCI